VTIQRSTGLTPEEVEVFQKEAAEFADADKALREQITNRVHAEALCAEAERTVQKYGERVEKSFVDKVMRALDLVKEALASDNPDEIKQLSAGLDVSLLDLGRAIHSGNRAAQPKKKTVEDSQPIELGESGQQTKGSNKETANFD
jgi:molecular chaperone DnaK (HSP70)